jgi:ABC-type dipeptide/oligopeptide/nickel transport system permease component
VGDPVTGAGFVLARLARALLTLIALVIVTQLLVALAPGPPGERAARAAGLLPADDSGVPVTTRRAIVDRVSADFGLERGLARRIGRAVAGLPTLDLGRSWRDGSSVRARVGRALAPTLVLCAGALVLAVGLGLGAAIVAVGDAGGPRDRWIAAAVVVGISLPPAWAALVALKSFALGQPWRWFPGGGLASLHAAVLPVCAAALVPTFLVTSYARASLRALLAAPWAKAVRARGVSRSRLVGVHALKAALPGLVGLVGILVAYLLGATLVVERVFGIHGLGDLVVEAAARDDAPVVAGATFAAGVTLAAASLLADVAQRALDPRQRSGSEASDGA